MYNSLTFAYNSRRQTGGCNCAHTCTGLVSLGVRSLARIFSPTLARIFLPFFCQKIVIWIIMGERVGVGWIPIAPYRLVRLCLCTIIYLFSKYCKSGQRTLQETVPWRLPTTLRTSCTETRKSIGPSTARATISATSSGSSKTFRTSRGPSRPIQWLITTSRITTRRWCSNLSTAMLKACTDAKYPTERPPSVTKQT